MFKQEPILQEVQILADLRRRTFVPHMEVAFTLFFSKLDGSVLRTENQIMIFPRKYFAGKFIDLIEHF